jgi:prephenate dehydrogenase
VRISIVGLGLIGGSAGMAWRAAGHEVLGYARRPETARRAIELGAIDRIAPTIAAAAEADVVVLAPPVLAIRSLMEQLAPHLGAETVVTDVASTKRVVERWALAILPAHVRFVGSHPMAGKETAGIDHADGTLFRNRTWCVVPPPGADDEAVRCVTQIGADTGARTLRIAAEKHDRAVAAVSHLPFMAAIGIAAQVIGRDDFAAISLVAGTGLRDMTRLASGDALMHRDICATNRDNIAAELERYAREIATLADLVRGLPNAESLASDTPQLMRLGERFAQSKGARDAWLQVPPAGTEGRQ